MKNKQAGFVPVLIILALAILGLVAYFGYSYLKPKQTATVPTPTVSSEPIAIASRKPVITETAGYKTYTNTKYKYSFKYPSSYVLSNIVDGSSNVVPQDAESVSLSKSRNSKYEDRLIDINYIGFLVDISPVDQWQKTSVVISGIKSLKFTKIDKSVNFDYYHIPTKGNEGIELMVNNKQQSDIDQILSTFKFEN